MDKDRSQQSTLTDHFETQLGVQLSQEIVKGLAGCTVYRGVDHNENPIVVKVGTSERGKLEIEDNLFGYQNLEMLGAITLIPSPIRSIESDLGPALVMPDLGEDFLTTSVDSESTKRNFEALTTTLEEVYESVVVKSPEITRRSLQDVLEKLSDRIKKFPEVRITGYESYVDLSSIDISKLAGENSSLFILDFTPSNLFVVDGKVKIIDPWRQSTYLGSPLLSLAQFITYAEDAYEIPGFNDENLSYSEFVQKVGRNFGLDDEQLVLHYKIGQALQYSLSAYYRINSQPEKAEQFLLTMASHIDDLRSYSQKPNQESSENKFSVSRLVDIKSQDFWDNSYPQLVDLYITAFSTSPWNLELSTEYVDKRLKDHFLKGTCRIIVSETEGRIVGASWFDQPTFEELSIMRGEEISRFAQEQLKERQINDFIWMRETLVYPQMQRKGVGESLRSNFAQYAKQNFPQGVLVLTRHREDNIGIIKLSTRDNYERTGIKQVAQIDGKPVDNEFWYKIFNKTS